MFVFVFDNMISIANIQLVCKSLILVTQIQSKYELFSQQKLQQIFTQQTQNGIWMNECCVNCVTEPTEYCAAYEF